MGCQVASCCMVDSPLIICSFCFIIIQRTISSTELSCVTLYSFISDEYPLLTESRRFPHGKWLRRNKWPKIYYEVHGEGEPLVLIMGLGSDSTGWLLQLPDFADHFKVITFDNRDVGRSSEATASLHYCRNGCRHGRPYGCTCY